MRMTQKLSEQGKFVGSLNTHECHELEYPSIHLGGSYRVRLLIDR